MFDPEKKRKELERRGWSPKRIDAYMNHSRNFVINPFKKPTRDSNERRNR
jgi:hypothetical protein